MPRRTIAVSACVVIVMAGCATTTQPVAQSGGTSGTMQNLITVTGTGEAAGVPDTLEIDLGVSVLAGSVSEANQRAADLAGGLISTLETNGVAGDDIQTVNYSVNPEYDYSGAAQRLVGYRVINTVRAKIRDIEGAGPIIDAAAAAGGDAITVDGLWFDIEHNADMMAAARASAWEDASRKATQLAELAGVPLGRAVSIDEVSGAPTPPIAYERAMLAADAATPIGPGTSVVRVTITVAFDIG